MRLEELIEEYKSFLNFQARERTGPAPTEQELKVEAVFWRRFNTQLSRAAVARDLVFVGIRGNADGKRTSDRVEIPHPYFVPAKKFTADCIAPYRSAAESRKEYVLHRQRKLDLPPYYYDVFVEKGSAERWLKNVKRGERLSAQESSSRASEEKAVGGTPAKLGRRPLGRMNSNVGVMTKLPEVAAEPEVAELGSKLRELTRDMIIAKLAGGEWTIERAEAEGRITGIWWLVRRPEVSSFDPFADPSWTIPMAISWIAFRSADRVVEQMDSWRERVRWYFDVDEGRMMTVAECEQQRRILGRKIEIKKMEPASHLSLTWEDSSDDNRQSLKNAWAELHIELRRGALEAAGFHEGKARIKKIPAHKWRYLVPGCDDRNRGDYVDPEGKDCWSRVTLASADVLNIWRDPRSIHEPTSKAETQFIDHHPDRSASKAKRGARAKFDWEHEIYPMLHELIKQNGVPDRSLDPNWTRSVCVKILAERYQNAFPGTFREPPARSTLFARLSLTLGSLSSNSNNSSN
jgi:hypothetical protein